MNKIDNNKYAGIGLVLGLLIGASISSIGAGAGLVMGMIIGAVIDKVKRKWIMYRDRIFV